MRTLVIGDMHLGCGAGPEIFTGVRVFEAFIEGATLHPTRIVLNGDTFDFLAHGADRDASEQQLMYAFVEDAMTSVCLAALGRAVARGGLLVIRVGEHDRALEQPAVQAILVHAIAGTDANATRISFHAGSEPTLLEIGGVRVLVTHDVHQRDVASACWIATHLFNPLRRQYGVGLADLLRPDYAAAMVAALAVNPTAAKHVFRRADEVAGPPGSGVRSSAALQLPRVFGRSGLTARERKVLSCTLDPAVAVGVSPEDSPALEQARLKVFRQVLNEHAALAGDEPRRIVGAEWNAARGLARRFGASVAVLGHSRAVGWRSEESLTAVDVGSWARLLAPSLGCGDEAWLRTLESWQRTVRVDGAADEVALRSQRTAALIEPIPAGGGAQLALVEWRPDSGLVCLRSHSLLSPAG